MSPFIDGLIAGYGIAIPVGAIAILIINMGIKCGFRIGFMAGAGAASADFIYAGIAVIAGSVLARFLSPIELQLRIVSAIILFMIAGLGLWRGLIASKKDSKKAEVCSAFQMFIQFISLTLINPLTVVYFTALILGRDHSIALSMMDRIAFVVGAGLASLSWQTLLAGLGGLGHQKLSFRFRYGAILLGNIIIIALGLRILYITV